MSTATDLQRQIAVSGEIVVGGERVIAELRELLLDAEAVHLHHAALRFQRALDCMTTTVRGLKTQHGKLKTRLERLSA